jgi:PhzF family phenazine biosynthesis protein
MRIRVVDAFADRAFAGNPAGVCVLEAGDWPDEGWMRAVAAEMKHAETAFVRPSAGAEAEWDLRWFTPTKEVVLCGHATLRLPMYSRRTERCPGRRRSRR